MPTFPEFDPETLAQAIKTFVTARNNVTAVSQLSRPDSFEVVRGWADALAAIQNPSLAYLENNDQTLFTLVGQTQGQGTPAPSLLFNIQGVISVGQWAVQVTDDTIAIADASTFSDGPVVGVVIEIPSPGVARIQNTGVYTYTGSTSYSFLPMTADETYYVSEGYPGDITTTPNPPSGGFFQEVGYAKTPLQFVISIQEPTEV